MDGVTGGIRNAMFFNDPEGNGLAGVGGSAAGGMGNLPMPPITGWTLIMSELRIVKNHAVVAGVG